MMKYSEAKPGRIFILRLEDGDILHEAVEMFACAHGIQAAALIVLGGADEGSKLVVGPEQGRSQPIMPMEHVLTGVHEVAGVGTLFPNASGQPVLHMHIAGGREAENGHRLRSPGRESLACDGSSALGTDRDDCATFARPGDGLGILAGMKA